MSNLSTEFENIKETTMMDISPNISDSEDEELSNEELSSKIKLFCNLSSENKINTSNAFNLNMVGYFYKWLEKKKHEDNFDVSLFHELADCLDTAGKIYCKRIKNVNENLNKLIHEIKTTLYKNSTKQSVNDHEGKMLKCEKPVRSKLMLTTIDKISKNKLDLYPKAVIREFTFQELFNTSRPSDCISSMYYDIPLKTELMKMKENKVENKNNKKYKMKNVKNEISKSHICSEFFEFVAEHDKNSGDNINYKLENSEDYFHCEIEPCQAFKMSYNSTESNANDKSYNEIISNEKSINDDNLMNVDDNLVITDDTLINNDDELGTTVKDNRSLLFDQLVDCIDGEQRDYSYFNPTLLAHWSGPTAWKSTAMVKALKSSNPYKQQKIEISPSDSIVETEIDNKKKKKRLNKSKDVKEIKWLTMSEMEPKLKKKLVGKQQLSSSELSTWNILYNRKKPPPIYVYNFKLLRCMTKEIHVMTSKTCDINEPYEGSPEYTLNKVTDNLNNSILEDSPNNSIMNTSQKDNCHDDSENATHLNIFELKNKIMEIIHRECVILRPNYEWTNNLAFSDLLTQLDNNDKWSVGSVYVSLLHLINEEGLRISPGYNSVTNLQEVYIAKLANKCNT